MKVEDLIEEMKVVKLANPTLETSDILRIFSIKATMELTSQTRRLADK